MKNRRRFIPPFVLGPLFVGLIGLFELARKPRFETFHTVNIASSSAANSVSAVASSNQDNGIIGDGDRQLDAVKVDPRHYTVDFENDRVRVVRVQYGPHEKSVTLHEHPGNSAGIYVTDFHAKITFPDGRTREVDASAGKTMWRAPAVTHISTENLSDQPMEALWVELKPRLGAADAGYDSKAEQEVRQVERELTEALSEGDFETVERIYAEDYALTTADGELQNKSRRIAALKSTDPKSINRNRDDITVRVYGGTAVVTGDTLFRSQVQGSPKGEDRRFTHVFVRRQGQWQMVTSQVTRISAQSQDTEANKALVRRYIEATNTHGHGDEAVLNEFIAPDFVRHGGKELRGIASFKENGRWVQATFPDWKWTIEDLIAEGDKVVVRETGRATQRGEFEGIPPTGKQVTLDVVMIYRIANGKIAEQWRTANDLGRLFQLGATIAPPGQPRVKKTPETAEPKDHDPQSEAEARKVIAAFNEANNKRDVEGMRNALNFPFIRIASDKVSIIRTREEFTIQDWPPGAVAEGWHHSAVDSVQFIQSSSDKVHAAIVFSRYKADGTRYATYRTLRIITKQDGHWGIQCSSSFAP